MAWNPSKEVGILRDASDNLGAAMSVLVYVLPNGQFGTISYGQTKALCGFAKKLGDRLHAATREWEEIDR